MKKVFMYTFDSFVHDSRITKEANSITKLGFDVTVIAHGDKGLKKKEDIKNIHIIRFSYLDREKTSNKLKKFLIYLDFLKQSILYSKDVDYLHCNDLLTLPIGFFIKKFFNKKAIVIYDAHEFETERNGLSPKKKKLIYYIEKFFIKSADEVITVSDSIANAYAKIYNIKKPHLILNTPNFQNLNNQNIFRKKFNISPEKTIFLYQGSLHKGRGVELLLKTFSSIKEKDKVIIFMGFGDLEDLIREKAKNSTSIFFQDAVSPSEILKYTSSADFGISLIEDTCLSYKYCLPNKMFEYLMAGIPVIVSNLPEMKKIVEEYKVGTFIEFNKKESIIDALNRAMNLDREVLKSNIYNVKKKYNWEEQEKVLKKIYLLHDIKYKKIKVKQNDNKI